MNWVILKIQVLWFCSFNSKRVIRLNSPGTCTVFIKYTFWLHTNPVAHLCVFYVKKETQITCIGKVVPWHIPSVFSSWSVLFLHLTPSLRPWLVRNEYIYIGPVKLLNILKRSRDCLLYTKKETNCVLFIVNICLHYFYITWKHS